MNFFSIIILIVTHSSLAMGLFVYIKNPKTMTNRMFFLLTLASLYWMITFFAFTSATTKEWAVFWRRIFSFWPLVVPIQLHFILVFTEHWKRLTKKIETLVVMYFSSFFVILLELSDMIADDLD